MTNTTNTITDILNAYDINLKPAKINKLANLLMKEDTYNPHYNDEGELVLGDSGMWQNCVLLLSGEQNLTTTEEYEYQIIVDELKEALGICD